MIKRVSVQDLRGLLDVIEMARTALETGCEDEDTIQSIEGACRCSDWVLKEIHRRERKIKGRAALAQGGGE